MRGYMRSRVTSVRWWMCCQRGVPNSAITAFTHWTMMYLTSDSSDSSSSLPTLPCSPGRVSPFSCWCLVFVHTPGLWVLLLMPFLCRATILYYTTSAEQAQSVEEALCHFRKAFKDKNHSWEPLTKLSLCAMREWEAEPFDKFIPLSLYFLQHLLHSCLSTNVANHSGCLSDSICKDIACLFIDMITCAATHFYRVLRDDSR